MKQKYSKLWKSILSLALVVCMIWGAMGPYVSQGEVEAEETTTEPDFSVYDVMTLKDNNISDDTYSANVPGDPGYRTNLNGVLYDFYVNTSGQLDLYLGGPSRGSWVGFVFQFNDGNVYVKRNGLTGNGNWQATFSTDKAQFNETMRVWITMDYVAAGDDGTVDDVKVGVWIDKVFVGEHTYPDISNLSTAVGSCAMFIKGTNTTYSVQSISAEERQEYYHTELSLSDFEVASKTYEIADVGVGGNKFYTLKNNNASSISLNGAVLSTNLTMVGSTDLRYGGQNRAYGLRFVTWQDNFSVRYEDSAGSQLKRYNGTTAEQNLINNGCDVKLFTTYIDSDADGEKDDLKVGLYLKNATSSTWSTHSVIDGASSFGGSNVNMCEVKADAVTTSKIIVNEPNVVLDESAYTRKTIDDVGFDFATAIANSKSNVQSTNGITSYDGIMFDANLTFKSGSALYYALPSSGWHAIKLATNSTSDGLTLSINGNTDYAGRSLSSKINTAISAPIGTNINLKLTTDYVDYDNDTAKDDVKLGIWVNGKLNSNHYIYLIDYVSYMKPLIVLENFDWSTPSSDKYKTLSDVYYNLADSDSGYLVTTSGSAYVNGEEHNLANALTTPGIYKIQKKQVISGTQNLIVNQNVTLYTMGDLNLDGSITADDTAILQSILLEDVESKVGELTGDVNNDGEITYDDLQILQEVVAGTRNISEVITEYGVPSTAYNHLDSDEVMPITGYWGPYSARIAAEDGETYLLYDYLNSDIYKLIANSGINTLVQTNNLYQDTPEAVLKELEMAEKYNLGILVRDNDLNDEVDKSDISAIAKRLGEYSQYNSFQGIYLMDEPYLGDYKTSTSQDKQDFTKYSDLAAVLNSYSNLQGYFNLLGCNGDKSAYQTYLGNVLSQGNLKSLAVSQYLIMDENDSVESANEYFTTLSELRAKSVQEGVPFSSYAQLGGDFSETVYNVTNQNALPTEAETYWQINMPLAFGAKAIEYFTVIQPVTMSRALLTGTECGENHHYCNSEKVNCGYKHDFDRVGLIGADGEPTTYYAYAKKANTQIAAVDEVLMKATSKGVITVGTQAQSNTSGLTGVYNTCDAAVTGKLESVTAASGNAYGTIVGCFDYQDTEAYYVVNYDVTKEQKITLTLKNEGTYSVILDAVESIGEGKVIEITIPAGEAALVVLDEDREATYVEFSDISAYRSTDVTVTPHIAPTLSGYVFAGWFTENGGSTAIAETTTSGSAWAKFVDEDLLNVKAQVRYYDVTAIDTMDIRFVTTVDTLKYKDIGFTLEYNDKVVDKTSNVIHSSLNAWEADGNTYRTYLPTDFCSEAEYFKAFTLTGVPSSAFNTPIKATAYWTTKDGTVVRGESSIKRVYQGIEGVTAPEKLGFTKRLTLDDFTNDGTAIPGGIYSHDGTSDRNMWGSYSGGLSNMDGSYLDLDIALPDNGNGGTRLSFASTENNSWYGIRVYVENGYLRILGNSEAKFLLSDYGATTGEIFNLKLGMKDIQTTDATDSCTIGVWINNMYAGCQTYTNKTTNVKLGAYLFATSANGYDRIIIRNPIE